MSTKQVRDRLSKLESKSFSYDALEFVPEILGDSDNDELYEKRLVELLQQGYKPSQICAADFLYSPTYLV